MIFLYFFAQRINPSPRWMFWRLDHAFVTAWVNESTVAAAKQQADEKMTIRGWRILRYEQATALPDDKLPDDLISRTEIREARASGARFSFWRASAEGGSGLIYMPQFAAGTAAETPIMDEYDADEKSVPPGLRPSLKLGQKWAISDDTIRARAIGGAPPDELRNVIDTVMPLLDEIEAWCDARRDQTPVPDEVTLFDRLLETVTEMEAESPMVENAETDSTTRREP